jgi:hypothetical protein
VNIFLPRISPPVLGRADKNSVGVGSRILLVREGSHLQPVVPHRDQFILRQMPQVEIFLAEEMIRSGL